jgi:hypothetical protein
MRLSSVDLPALNPFWNSGSHFNFSLDWLSFLFRIFSSIFPVIGRRLIGLNSLTFIELPGLLGIGIILLLSH